MAHFGVWRPVLLFSEYQRVVHSRNTKGVQFLAWKYYMYSRRMGIETQPINTIVRIVLLPRSPSYHRKRVTFRELPFRRVFKWNGNLMLCSTLAIWGHPYYSNDSPALTCSAAHALSDLWVLYDKKCQPLFPPVNKLIVTKPMQMRSCIEYLWPKTVAKYARYKPQFDLIYGTIVL